ncbi:myosin-IIIa isoform X2 [Brachionus plicatilis]|uniref:Myosin-IIIa isoform X2 n=1 Tax=Brachionus plicatilis TaxID=10195 RepID=A0A3M7Q6M8_BRAPC|nr:myosin-IIIa isoform X2 [Brachionus plicatilis]
MNNLNLNLNLTEYSNDVNTSIDQSASAAVLNYNNDYGDNLLSNECLKPNHERKSNKFDQDLISEQLKYNGLLDIAHIRNQGWPYRMHFEDFLDKYQIIAFPMCQELKPIGKHCESILKELDIKDYAIGKTKHLLNFRQKLEIDKSLGVYFCVCVCLCGGSRVYNCSP